MQEHLPFFTEYKGESLAQVLALEGEYRLDSLVITVEQALGVRALREGDATLSDAEAIVLAVAGLEREMNNGGYWRFFAGSGSEFVSGIVEALSRIDCLLTAEATAEAMQAFGITDSMTADQVRAAAMEMDVEDQQALNTAFFASGEDIARQLFDFIRQNRDYIRIP
jgi:hypothetical protein